MLSNSQINAYVELDCLLDTRLGTLAKIEPGSDVALIETGKYYDRWNDDFASLVGVEKEVYDFTYGHRDKEILKLSKTTLVYKLINNVLTEHYLKYMQKVIDVPPSLTVNIYPYELTKKEVEVLEALLATIIVTFDIRIIRENPEKLPPWEMKKSYQHIWMYDFDEYIRPFYTKLDKHPSGNCVFHFPAICRGDYEKAKDQEEIVHGFTRVQEGLAGYLTVDFNLVFDYSFHLHTTEPKVSIYTEELTAENLEAVASRERHDLDLQV